MNNSTQSQEYRNSITPKGSYPKHATLKHWAGMESNQDVIPHFDPIPNKSTGSSYGACGIRIDGNPEFIDAVMSRLQDLLQLECSDTRLELARSKVLPKTINGQTKTWDKACTGAEVCYIRLHSRGPEAQHFNGILRCNGGCIVRHFRARHGGFLSA